MWRGDNGVQRGRSIPLLKHPADCTLHLGKMWVKHSLQSRNKPTEGGQGWNSETEASTTGLSIRACRQTHEISVETAPLSSLLQTLVWRQIKQAGVGYSPSKHSSQRQNGLFVSLLVPLVSRLCSWFSSDGVSIVVPLPSNKNASFQQILSLLCVLFLLSPPLVSLSSLLHERDVPPCGNQLLFRDRDVSLGGTLHTLARACVCAGFRLLSELKSYFPEAEICSGVNTEPTDTKFPLFQRKPYFWLDSHVQMAKVCQPPAWAA